MAVSILIDTWTFGKPSLQLAGNPSQTQPLTSATGRSESTCFLCSGRPVGVIREDAHDLRRAFPRATLAITSRDHTTGAGHCDWPLAPIRLILASRASFL